MSTPILVSNLVLDDSSTRSTIVDLIAATLGDSDRITVVGFIETYRGIHVKAHLMSASGRDPLASVTMQLEPSGSGRLSAWLKPGVFGTLDTPDVRAIWFSDVDAVEISLPAFNTGMLNAVQLDALKEAATVGQAVHETVIRRLRAVDRLPFGRSWT